MEITTERLLLREFEPDDWPAVLAYQQDVRYSEYYPWSARTESDAKEFVQWFLDEQAVSPRRRFQMAVILLETGQLIGNCGIRRKPDNEWEADIGYEIAPEFWGIRFLTVSGVIGYCTPISVVPMHSSNFLILPDGSSITTSE